MELCCAVCTDVDGYDMNFNPQANLTPQQKMLVFGNAAQLDYMFFEKDNGPCTVNEDGSMIFITLCYGYMCGFLYPLMLCIPTGGGG
jgi:hypothetical protein